jgi:putative redox protein
VVIEHILKGKNLDPKVVERAVRLSDEKYCSASATLREPVKVQMAFRIEE